MAGIQGPVGEHMRVVLSCGCLAVQRAANPSHTSSKGIYRKGSRLLAPRIRAVGLRPCLCKVHGVRGIASGRRTACLTVRGRGVMAGVPFAHRKRKIGEMSGEVAGIENHPIELRNRTAAILYDASIELGVDLVDAVTQGSWCKGCVPESEGFHDGAGVFDLSSSVATDKVELALRKRGVAAWIRPKNGFPSRHIHGVDAFDPNLDDKTQGQVDDYRDGLSGLAGDQDTDPHTGDLHPTLKAFPDPESETEMEVLMALSSKARDELGKAVANHKITSDGTQVSLGGLIARANRGASNARAAAKAANDAANAAKTAATGAKTAATGATTEAKAATKAAKDATDAAKAASTAATDAIAAAHDATTAANNAARAAVLAATEAAKARALAEAAAASSGMTRKDIQGLLAAAASEVTSAIAGPHR